MDTYSASQAARLLGSTPPRVLRAVARLGLSVPRGRSGALELTTDQLARIAEVVDESAPPPGLTRVQARVLAALSRSPRGLTSTRAVGRRAGVSPTAAGRALKALVASGLACAEEVMVARGHATAAIRYQACVTSPRWPELAPHLARIRLPDPARLAPARRVPFYLRHLFWNTSPRQLDVATSADYIARRLLTVDDPDGLAWGVRHLPVTAWEHAARSRGLAPQTRALARNLARAHRDAA